MRGSLLTLTIVNLSWHAMEVSIQVTAVAVQPTASRHLTGHSRGSGKPSYRDWLLVPVIAFALSNLIFLLCGGSEWEWMGHVEPSLRYASMWALQRLFDGVATR